MKKRYWFILLLILFSGAFFLFQLIQVQAQQNHQPQNTPPPKSDKPSMVYTPKVFYLTGKDHGSQIYLHPQDLLEIRLGTEDGDHYLWDIVRNQGDLLDLINQPKFIPANLTRPGPLGSFLFKFRARTPGNAALKLGYLRRYAEPPVPLKVFILKLKITPRLQPKTVYRLESNNIREKKPEFSIQVSYPRIKNLPNIPLQEKLNQQIQQVPDQLLKDFKARLLLKPKNLNQPWILSLEYREEFKSQFYLSLLFEGDRFCSEAHPFPQLSTQTYELSTGRELTLNQLFKPNSQFLQVISAYCIGYLKKHNDPKHMWIDTGAAPKAGNYRYFTLTQEGLKIIFPKAQVAPYVNGEIEVIVPYHNIKNLLKIDWLKEY